MTLHLFDPRDTTDFQRDYGPSIAKKYIEMLASADMPSLIANVKTRILALRSGKRVFPITVNDDEIGNSYVCEPYSAYILYSKEEMDIVDIGWLKWLFKPMISLASIFLRIAQINRIVHVDNWLLSTNLHGDWDGADINAIRELLISKYPDHIIAIRSLDYWSNENLLRAVQNDRWYLFPSRQIWVTNDMEKQWLPRHSVREDKRILRKSELTTDTIKVMTNADAERIAELYHMLYVGKYSPLNPIFLPKWIQETCRLEIIRYRCARDGDDQIQAVAGSFCRADVLTPPIVGYDTSRPQSLGLYRIASLLFSEDAMQAHVRLHGSAGAASFKRFRGAEAYTEYSAYFIDHLSLSRRLILKTLSIFLNHIAVPMMRKYQL